METGTLMVATTPAVPLRSSSSKTASVTWMLPLDEAMRPLRLSFVSLLAGTDETSTSSHFSVSRSFGPVRLKSPLTVGRAGSPDMVDFACRTMSPGKVAVRRGTATAPPLASSSTATLRIDCLL